MKLQLQTSKFIVLLKIDVTYNYFKCIYEMKHQIEPISRKKKNLFKINFVL